VRDSFWAPGEGEAHRIIRSTVAAGWPVKLTMAGRRGGRRRRGCDQQAPWGRRRSSRTRPLVWTVAEGDREFQIEQNSFLAQFPNLSRFLIITFRSKSKLNFVWILKEFKPFGKNLINSLKFYLHMMFKNMKLY
jgi:hypothetical protein